MLLAPREPSRHLIFPKRRMHSKLPDIVSPLRRSPRRFFRPHAAKRAPQIRPVPRRLLKSFVNQREKLLPLRTRHLRPICVLVTPFVGALP